MINTITLEVRVQAPEHDVTKRQIVIELMKAAGRQVGAALPDGAQLCLTVTDEIDPINTVVPL